MLHKIDCQWIFGSEPFSIRLRRVKRYLMSDDLRQIQAEMTMVWKSIDIKRKDNLRPVSALDATRFRRYLQQFSVVSNFLYRMTNYFFRGISLPIQKLEETCNINIWFVAFLSHIDNRYASGCCKWPLIKEIFATYWQFKFSLWPP